MANNDGFWKFFNLKKVSDELAIQPDKVYNNFKGRYASFTDAQETQIAQLLKPQVEALFNRLGFSVSFKKIKK